MSYVYMVRCRDGSLYTGYAEDVVSRVANHNDGTGAKYTRGRRPVTLVYTQWAENRSKAQQLESGLKKLQRAQKLAMCQAWAEEKSP